MHWVSSYRYGSTVDLSSLISYFPLGVLDMFLFYHLAVFAAWYMSASLRFPTFSSLVLFCIMGIRAFFSVDFCCLPASTTWRILSSLVFYTIHSFFISFYCLSRPNALFAALLSNPLCHIVICFAFLSLRLCSSLFLLSLLLKYLSRLLRGRCSVVSFIWIAAFPRLHFLYFFCICFRCSLSRVSLSSGCLPPLVVFSSSYDVFLFILDRFFVSLFFLLASPWLAVILYLPFLLVLYKFFLWSVVCIISLSLLMTLYLL